MTADIRAARARLQAGKFTCVLRCGDAEHTATARGVVPLLRWLDEGVDLHGFSAADKVVGQGAAFLYVLLGVRAVWAAVMSTAARDTLQQHGITAMADDVVSHIVNRRGDGRCPIETAVEGVSDPREALRRMRAALAKLKGSANMRQYGLQLYSVKGHMEADMAATLREVAEMGYTMVETAGFFGKTAEEFRALCDENGLTVCSTHSPLGDLAEDKREETIAFHKTIGNARYIIPGAPWDTKEGLADTIQKLNAYQPALAEAGMELMYHNHHGELLPNKDGQIAHVEMQKQTAIRFQIDVYWAYRGGVAPLYILEQLKERLAVVHLKDGTAEHGTPLGQGDVPIAAIVEWAEANGVDMVVENEPHFEREMIETKMCIDYLRSLEA